MNYTWHYYEEWRLYGVPDGPYIIEKTYITDKTEAIYTAWLLGHKCVGQFSTLEEAKEACEKDVGSLTETN